MTPLTLATTTTTIKRLEAINPLDEYAYENALLAFHTLEQLPVLFWELPKGLKIFRTRTHEKKELFNTILDISIAPNQVVKDFARCNRPFQSKFYGSETRPTSYIELVENWSDSNKIGDTIYVTTGLWVTKKPLIALIVTTPDLEERTSEFDIHHGKALDNFIGENEGECKESMILFYRFLFERFRKPAKPDPLTYIITSAYCNLILTEYVKVNSICYPSVPFGGKGENFAINADFINSENITLKLAMCAEIRISEDENKQFSFTEGDSWKSKPIIGENEIEWL